MTRAMTNPMNGILRLWKETLFLQLIDKIFFVKRALTHLYYFSKGRKGDVKNCTRDFVHPLLHLTLPIEA